MNKYRILGGVQPSITSERRQRTGLMLSPAQTPSKGGLRR